MSAEELALLSKLAKPVRSETITHRLAVTADDKLADFTAGDVTIADGGVGTGSLAASTAYYVTACPGNSYGNTKASIIPIDTLTTAAYGASTGSIRATIAQRVGAEYYDLFLSTDAAPKWVGRITEAQRAAGGFKVSALGVVEASAGVPAGKVDICCVGTGVATSAAPFNANNAFVIPTPDNTISLTGKSNLCLHFDISLTDLRSAPTFGYMVMTKNATTGRWVKIAGAGLTLLSGAYSLLSQSATLVAAGNTSVAGASEVIVLLDNMTGQGISIDIYAETM